jgi:hypothetical protein
VETPTTDVAPDWLGRSRLDLFFSVIGGARQNFQKARNIIFLFLSFLDGRSVDRRLQRLLERGHIEAIPTRAQLWIAARDQILVNAVEETKALYQRKGIPWVFHNLRRFIAEPSTMMDPLGFYSSADSIVNHLLQTVHHHPLYDMELLCAHEGGLELLQSQFRQLMEGAHMHQRALESLVEDPAYWPRLAVQIPRFVADPLRQDYPALSHLPAHIQLGLDQFKNLRGTARYASRLRVGRWDVLVAVVQVVLGLGPRGFRVECCDDALRRKYAL